MKFKIHLKDPDGVHVSLIRAANESLEPCEGTLDAEEMSHLVDDRYERCIEAAGDWLRDGEYLTVEIDTETRTAKVLPS